MAGQQSLLILAFSLASLVVGWGYAYLFQPDLEGLGITPLVQSGNPYLDAVLSSTTGFVLSAALYGWGSLLFMLFTGVVQGSSVKALTTSTVVKLVLGVIPLIVSAYAGTMLGAAARKDLDGQGNLRIYFKSVALLFALGVALGLAASHAIASAGL